MRFKEEKRYLPQKIGGLPRNSRKSGELEKKTEKKKGRGGGKNRRKKPVAQSFRVGERKYREGPRGGVFRLPLTSTTRGLEPGKTRTKKNKNKGEKGREKRRRRPKVQGKDAEHRRGGGKSSRSRGGTFGT